MERLADWATALPFLAVQLHAVMHQIMSRLVDGCEDVHRRVVSASLAASLVALPAVASLLVRTALSLSVCLLWPPYWCALLSLSLCVCCGLPAGAHCSLSLCVSAVASLLVRTLSLSVCLLLLS
jgi:hypothetical protein